MSAFAVRFLFAIVYIGIVEREPRTLPAVPSLGVVVSVGPWQQCTLRA